VSIKYLDGASATTSSFSAVAPVALDLGHDGISYLSTAAGVTFDFNGDGTGENTAWVAPTDGILVHDANGDGRVNNAGEIVFSVNGSTDLEGLRQTYDSNGDGKLTAADAAYASFGVWQDANSDGVVDSGEFHTLGQLGITSIDLVSDGNSSMAAGGDVLVSGESSYTDANGAHAVGDVSFATISAANDDEAAEQEQQSSTLNAVTTAALAAGLVATVVTPVAAEESTAAVQTEPVTGGAAAEIVAATPASSDDASTAGQLLDSSSASAPTDAPAAKVGGGEDSGSSHDAAEALDAAPAPSALLDDSHIQLPDVAPTAAPSVDMAAAMPALAAAGDGQVAQVLADALTGGADVNSPSIDQLLSSLPGATQTPDLHPLLQAVEQAAAGQVEIPHDILAMLTQMATEGHDAAVLVAASS
jgi:hypothetical protein